MTITGISISGKPLVFSGYEKGKDIFSLGKLYNIITFTLNYFMYDRIYDGNGVEKYHCTHDYVTVASDPAERYRSGKK